MKKLFAMLLALVMCLALCVPVFASEVGGTDGEEEPAPTYTDTSSVEITKNYTVEGDTTANAVIPGETYYLKQVSSSVSKSEATAAPALIALTGNESVYVAKVVFADNARSGKFVVTLPNYDRVGVYEYILQEVAGNTAGIVYHSADIKLVVTVINDVENGKLRVAAVHTEGAGQNKSGSFDNIYQNNTLTVKKTVEGNLGDKNRTFEFKVTFTAPENKTVKSTISYIVNSTSNTVTFTEGKAEVTLNLKHGDEVIFTNIPYGVGYTVTETPVDGYTITKSGETGTIGTTAATAAFVNTREGEIDMGVTLESLPYVLALVIVAGGAAVMFARKRRVED